MTARQILTQLLALGAVAGLILGTVWLTRDTEGHRRTERLNAEMARFSAQNQHLRSMITEARSEIERLKAGGEAITHHARATLGMVKPGEVVYRFEVQPDGAGGQGQAPGKRGAR